MNSEFDTMKEQNATLRKIILKQEQAIKNLEEELAVKDELLRRLENAR